jgi:3-hydroxybutyrate dehydrogenase
MTGLTGKVAVVTGAASGIGLAIAQSLAQQGARTVCSDSDAEAGQAAANGLLGARFLRADLARGEDSHRLIESAHATAGTIDILINNAGIQHVAPITEFPEAKWRQILEIMLTAPFLLTQAVLPGMYARLGAHRQYRLGPCPARFGLQIRLRRRQARLARLNPRHGA